MLICIVFKMFLYSVAGEKKVKHVPLFQGHSHFLCAHMPCES